MLVSKRSDVSTIRRWRIPGYFEDVVTAGLFVTLPVHEFAE